MVCSYFVLPFCVPRLQEADRYSTHRTTLPSQRREHSSVHVPHLTVQRTQIESGLQYSAATNIIALGLSSCLHFIFSLPCDLVELNYIFCCDSHTHTISSLLYVHEQRDSLTPLRVLFKHLDATKYREKTCQLPYLHN